MSRLQTFFARIVVLCALLVCFITSSTSDAQVTTRQIANTKTISTFLTGFSIPFTVDEEDETLLEVQLFLSKDNGKKWELYDRQDTNEKEFSFKSNGDGEYWFALRTLDRNRRLIPEGRVVAPELRVIVDTVKPKLEFNAHSDAAGRVVCQWRANDENIDPASVKIGYRDARGEPDSQWIPVDIRLNKKVPAATYTDQLAWWPQTPARQLTVRFQIADSAGNEVSSEQTIVVEYVAQIHKNKSTARPNSYAQSSRPPVQHFADRSAAPAPKANGMICKDGVCFPAPKTSPRPPANNATRPLLARTPFSPFRQVGSREEYAAPPVPEPGPAGQGSGNSNPVNQLAGTALPRPAQQQAPETGSIKWESKRDRWAIKRSASEGSTLAQNQYRRQDIEANQPVRRRVPAQMASHGKPPEALPPNQLRSQSFVKTEGNMVISQSTAIGRGRKWENSEDKPAAFGVSQSDQAMRWKAGTSKPDPAQPPAALLEADQVVQQQAVPTHNASFGQQVQQPPVPTQQQPPAPIQQQSQPIGPIGPTKDLPSPQSLPQPVDKLAGPPSSSMPIYNPNKPPAEPARSTYVQTSAAHKGVPQQIVNKYRFRLNYDVQAIDPSGVARVVLWMTRDGGQSWQSHSTDQDNQSPFPVAVQEEGSYGFKVVIHSHDGLAGKAPSSGESPDMFVHVDVTKPKVQIMSAPYGRGDKVGHLIINWLAFDQQLVSHPIRLAYSTTLSGPWTTIAQNIENTGSHAWKVPQHIPRQIYLRIEARDAAGNATAYELQSQVDLSGLTPRGRVLGVDAGN